MSRGSWWRNEQGYVTIESSLVFPIVMSVIVLFLISSLFLYQVVLVQYVAQTASSRTAFIWDDRERDFSTGVESSNYYYGLYQSDQIARMLSQLFRFQSPLTETNLSIRQDVMTSDVQSGFATDKLTQAAEYLIEKQLALNGTVHFGYKGIFPMIEVNIQKENGGISWSELELISPPHTISRSIVTDPVGFIRGVDLLRYYKNKWNASEWNSKKEKAEKAVKSFSDKE